MSECTILKPTKTIGGNFFPSLSNKFYQVLLNFFIGIDNCLQEVTGCSWPCVLLHAVVYQFVRFSGDCVSLIWHQCKTKNHILNLKSPEHIWKDKSHQINIYIFQWGEGGDIFLRNNVLDDFRITLFCDKIIDIKQSKRIGVCLHNSNWCWKKVSYQGVIRTQFPSTKDGWVLVIFLNKKHW